MAFRGGSRRVQKLRPSYSDDANYLIRLAKAIEADTRQTKEWRMGVSALLQEISSRLVDVNKK